jgi:hypothetical protein
MVVVVDVIVAIVVIVVFVVGIVFLRQMLCVLKKTCENK